jgi:hypothetical protein
VIHVTFSGTESNPQTCRIRDRKSIVTSSSRDNFRFRCFPARFRKNSHSSSFPSPFLPLNIMWLQWYQLHLHFFLLLCSLFNYATSNTDYIAINDWVRVNNILEMIWKEGVVACFKVLSQICPEGLKLMTKGLTEDNRRPADILTRRLPSTNQQRCRSCSGLLKSGKAFDSNQSEG